MIVQKLDDNDFGSDMLQRAYVKVDHNPEHLTTSTFRSSGVQTVIGHFVDVDVRYFRCQNFRFLQFVLY